MSLVHLDGSIGLHLRIKNTYELKSNSDCEITIRPTEQNEANLTHLLKLCNKTAV